MPERKQATCQPESEVALITAPPVEKSSAAPRIKTLENLASTMRERIQQGIEGARVSPLGQ